MTKRIAILLGVYLLAVWVAKAMNMGQPTASVLSNTTINISVTNVVTVTNAFYTDIIGGSSNYVGVVSNGWFVIQYVP